MMRVPETCKGIMPLYVHRFAGAMVAKIWISVKFEGLAEIFFCSIENIDRI